MSHTPRGPHSKSVSRSRPLLSRRATSQRSVPYLPNGPADLALPAGVVGEEAADLLHDFIHPGHHAHEAEETLVDGDSEPEEDDFDTRERAGMMARPWWRRPAPWW
jgi:hypothetical protein